MKKLLPLLLLSASCLASCGQTSAAGVYKFSLGRKGDDQMRIGIEFDLSNEKFEVPESMSEEEKAALGDAKKFTLKFDLGNIIDSTIDNLDFDEEFKEMIRERVNEILEEGIHGYYTILDEINEKYGHKVALGLDLSFTGESDLPISSELIKNIVVCYTNGNKLTLQIPVSIEDLQNQLCWYSGLYIDLDPYIKKQIHEIEDVIEYLPDILLNDGLKFAYLDEFSKLPGKEGDARFGSHPQVYKDEDDKVIKDEIALMNEQYAGVFSNTFVYGVNDDGSRGDIIGSVFESSYNNVKIHDFLPLNDFVIPDTGTFSGYVVTNESFLFAKEEIKVDMHVYNIAGINDHDVEYMKVSGDQGSYVDGQDMPFEDFEKDAFTFRDFHDIKLELTKE